MSDENEQQKYLKEFETYFPASDRESGVIKEIREALVEFKQITDVGERYKKFRPILRNYREKYYRANLCYVKGDLEKDISKYDTIDKYDNLTLELNNLVEEDALETMRRPREEEKSSSCHCSNCQDTQNQLDQAKQEIQTLKEKIAKLENQQNLNPDHSNQIKSNQIKSNQIKSNQIKSWVLVS